MAQRSGVLWSSAWALLGASAAVLVFGGGVAARLAALGRLCFSGRPPEGGLGGALGAAALTLGGGVGLVLAGVALSSGVGGVLRQRWLLRAAAAGAGRPERDPPAGAVLLPLLPVLLLLPCALAMEQALGVLLHTPPARLAGGALHLCQLALAAGTAVAALAGALELAGDLRAARGPRLQG